MHNHISYKRPKVFQIDLYYTKISTSNPLDNTQNLSLKYRHIRDANSLEAEILEAYSNEKCFYHFSDIEYFRPPHFSCAWKFW